MRAAQPGRRSDPIRSSRRTCRRWSRRAGACRFRSTRLGSSSKWPARIRTTRTTRSARLICPKWTSLGFTSHGHTGGDVPLFAFGPGRPVGLLDGPEIGKLTARRSGLDLEQLNQRLFVDVERAIPDAQVSVEAGESGNLVVRIALGDKSAELPVNKNLLVLAGNRSSWKAWSSTSRTPRECTCRCRPSRSSPVSKSPCRRSLGKSVEGNECRLSLRESTAFRGAKGDSAGNPLLCRS